MTALVALFLLFAVAQYCAAATTWTVTSDADSGEGTLRETLANAADGDTIMFSLTEQTTIMLTEGPLQVHKSISILGPGQDQLTVDAEQLDRVFYIAPEKIVLISGVTIANGKTSDKDGGGVYNEGTLTLNDCTLTANQADGGGAVSNKGTLTLTGCTLSENKAVRQGGAVYSEGTLTLTGCTLSDNIVSGDYDPGDDWVATGSGGAISFRSVQGMGVSDVSLTLDRCTLSRNIASGVNALGGAIFVCVYPFMPPITVMVMNSTLEGNTASGDTLAYGGAIVNGLIEYPDADTGGNVIIQNCTFSGNSALGGTHGGIAGAIINVRGSLTVDNSTLVDNYDNYGKSDDPENNPCSGILNLLGPLKIKNTILANDPSGMNLMSFQGGGESLVEDLGFNLCTDDCGGFLDLGTDLLNTDPMLGPLQDNGGPTWTHALLEDSPAIDTADSTDSTSALVESDQRGVARPQGEYNDIGAFELEGSGFEYEWSGVLPPINPDGTSVFKAGSTVPVKFMLTGSSAGITDLEATLSYTKIANGSPGAVNESVSTSAATTGNLFRYDSASETYIFNWSTKGLPLNTYRLYIDLGDGVGRSVDVGLK